MDRPGHGIAFDPTAALADPGFHGVRRFFLGHRNVVGLLRQLVTVILSVRPPADGRLIHLRLQTGHFAGQVSSSFLEFCQVRFELHKFIVYLGYRRQ